MQKKGALDGYTQGFCMAYVNPLPQKTLNVAVSLGLLLKLTA
jgi:hypothetical protein